MLPYVIAVCVIAAIAIFLLRYYSHKKCLFKATTFTCVSGIGSLAIINLLGGVLGITVPITVVSTLFCGVLGVPGMVTLMLVKAIWQI